MSSGSDSDSSDHSIASAHVDMAKDAHASKAVVGRKRARSGKASVYARIGHAFEEL